MTRPPSNVRLLAAAGALLGLTLLSACGSGDSSSSAGGSTDSTSSGSSKAESQVKALEARPTSIGTYPKVKGKIPSNLTVAVMNTDQPAGDQFNKSTSEAMQAMGLNWKYVNVHQGVTPESIKAAWDNVVRTKPDAIIADGMSRTLVQSQCQELEKLNIPVFDAAVTDDNLGSCVKGIVYGASVWEGLGAGMADWMIADSGGDAHVVAISGNEFGILQSVATGIKNELTSQCPKCTYDQLDVQSADIGTAVPGQIEGYLRSHPDVKYVAATFDDLLLGVPAALQAAGLTDVKLVGQNPHPDNQVEIANGGMEKAAISFGPENLAWTAVDAVARSFAGDSSYKTVDYDPEGQRGWLLTGDNVNEWGGPPDQLWPNTADYQKQFTSLWTAG
jgi:ribose transport system substrate-binding protein